MINPWFCIMGSKGVDLDYWYRIIFISAFVRSWYVLGCNFEVKLQIFTKYHCCIVVKISFRPGSKHHWLWSGNHTQSDSWFLNHTDGKLDAFGAVSRNKIYVAVNILIFTYYSFSHGYLIRIGISRIEVPQREKSSFRWQISANQSPNAVSSRGS